MNKRLGEMTIGFLGGGNMAAALIKGVLAAKVVAPPKVIVSDVKADRLAFLEETHGIRTTQDNHELVKASDVVVLAVKPQVFDKVLDAVGADFRVHQLLVSVAAGVPVSAMEARLPDGARVVRSMPNTPATVDAGATAIAAGTHATDEDLEVARGLFSAVGRVVTLDETLLDAVTGLSGSGPAYVFVFLEALGDAGVRMGLPRDAAYQLAFQTVLGAARLAIEDGRHPAALKDQVTSPGGTTIAGLERLEAGGLRAAVCDAVAAATRRSVELSQDE